MDHQISMVKPPAQHLDIPTRLDGAESSFTHSRMRHEAPLSVFPAFHVAAGGCRVFNVLHHLADAHLQFV